MLLAEARKLCPELVVVEGEDLSPFRDVSKQLYALLRSYSWNGKAERLGLDEVFLDVTDMVDHNVGLLNPHSLARSFFHLSRLDPENGFEFDATAIAGCVSGPRLEGDALRNPLVTRLLVASHLARHLRLRVEERGYTSSCGISTNKLLSKLVGNRNKPRNQTTLLSLCRADAVAFVDRHPLRKVPGIGSRTTRLLEAHVLQKEPEPETHSMECSVTAGEVRNYSGMSDHALERLLGAPGAERGIGEKVWGLLHGVERTEVKAATDLPTQISIEDTYRGLDTLAEITQELRKLAASLLRRMHVDLVDDDDNGDDETIPAASERRRRWLAHPRTLRLTTRPKTSPGDDKPYNFKRVSRSQPLPSFVFRLATPREDIVDKLVSEHLLPMFRKLNPERDGWHTGLLNVCVANMVPTATSDPAGRGRDISVMFRTQEHLLREFRVYDPDPPEGEVGGGGVLGVWGGGDAPNDRTPASPVEDGEGESADEGWGDEGESGLEDCITCGQCGHRLPAFAAGAHQRYHLLGDQ